jgi:hypothetical protein
MAKVTTNLEEIVHLLEILLGGQAVEGVGDQSNITRGRGISIISATAASKGWEISG